MAASSRRKMKKGREQTVILSRAFWQRRFGSDPGVWADN
jgi:hypothetical protein